MWHKQVKWAIPILIGWGIVITLLATAWVYNASASSYKEPSVYRLQRGSETMPYRIKLRHCLNVEDTMARLTIVSYTPERVVYRCPRAVVI